MTRLDWTELDALEADAENVRLTPLALKAGEIYSLQFTVTPASPN